MSLHPSEIFYITTINNKRRGFAIVIPTKWWVYPVATLDQLRTAWTAVLRNHPALLRSYHRREGGGWKALTIKDVDSVVQSHVVEVPTILASQEYIQDQFWKLVNQVDGCLWRLALVSGPDSNGAQMLSCLFHHLLTDSTSNYIIRNQLAEAISQVLSGKSNIVLVPEQTPYESYVSALIQYAKSNLMTRDFSYWSAITQEDLFYVPSTTGNPKSIDCQQRNSLYFTESQIQTFSENLKKYNSTLYIGVLLSILHTLNEITGKTQGHISTVIHGRNIPKKMVGKEGESLNVWNTVGSLAYISWEKYGIQGNTLQEQLDNLSLMAKEIKRSGLDFTCLMYTNQGNQVIKRIHSMNSISLNFVLSTDAVKTNNNVNITRIIDGRMIMPQENMDATDNNPNSSISIMWWNDYRLLRGLFYNQFHSSEFVSQFLEKIEKRLLTWFGGDSAKL